jgi:DNA-binding LacI/PurR family transcriptional regulator
LVTIIDVARAAGVAPSTVSYVLNGKRPISADTRRQVEQCIRQLGYRPVHRRTATPRVRTNVLGLLAPGGCMPAMARFVSAAMVAAGAREQDLLLLTHDSGLAGLRRAMSTAVADALIVLDVPGSDPMMPALMSLDRPVVLVGTPDRPTDLSCVDLDYGTAANHAVEHLVSLGHRSVAVVGSPRAADAGAFGYPRRFTRALQAAADERGLRVRRRPCGGSHDAVRHCLDALFAEDSTTTALVVENELVLAAVLQHLGSRVPADVSVVAVCRDDVAERSPVPLTSVPVPAAQLGELAVDMALRQFDGEMAPEIRLLTPALTIRESTAATPVTFSGASC